YRRETSCSPRAPTRSGKAPPSKSSNATPPTPSAEVEAKRSLEPPNILLRSDVSVRRPVFAAVISLILVILGLMSVRSLPTREYPDIERPIVSISTNYRGAASDVVERRVTQIIEDRIVGISGIEKI